MTQNSVDHLVHQAAASNSAELEQLLSRDPELRDRAGWHGRHPLHVAAESGNARSIELLLRHGADPNCEEGLHGDTPLVCAVESDCFKCIELLLRSGADPNKTGRRGQSPVFMARSVVVIGLLADAGANLDVKDEHGDEPFQNCASYIGELDVLRFWIDRGINLDAQPQVGWPALHGIVGGSIPDRLVNEEQRVEMLALLLDGGATIDLKDRSGATALYYACQSHLHLTKCVELLLGRGASPNLCDRWGNSPLVYSVTRGYLDIAELLLQHGADPNLPNHHRNYPLDFCNDVEPPEQRECFRQLLTPVTTKVEHPLPTKQHVLKRLLAIPKYQAVPRQKCPKAEIDELEAGLGVQLPKSYRNFLAELGNGIGDFMISDHWRFRIKDVPDLYRDDEYPQVCDLPDNYFVFAERNGYWWAFFVLDGNNDPPVFCFDDGEERSYRLANRSIWEFVESLVIDYEHWFGEKQSQRSDIE